MLPKICPLSVCRQLVLGDKAMLLYHDLDREWWIQGNGLLILFTKVWRESNDRFIHNINPFECHVITVLVKVCLHEMAEIFSKNLVIGD